MNSITFSTTNQMNWKAMLLLANGIKEPRIGVVAVDGDGYADLAVHVSSTEAFVWYENATVCTLHVGNAVFQCDIALGDDLKHLTERLKDAQRQDLTAPSTPGREVRLA